MRDCHIRAVLRGMAKEQTSQSFLLMQRKWKCAFSTTRANRNASASNYRSAPTKFGMALCPMWARAPYMDIVSTVHMNQKMDIDSTPTNLLLDPYAVAYIGELVWDPAVFGYKMESMDDLTFDERDSAPFMPKCVVVDPNFDWGETPGRARRGSQRQLAVSFNDTIIYEMHVRGYTKKHPAVPEYLRGTYCGLAQPAVLDYIKSLGVTSIELLPDPCLHQRQPPAGSGTDELLGIQQHWIFCSRSPLCL